MDKLMGYMGKSWDWLTARISMGNSQDSMKVVMAYGFLIGIVSFAFLLAWVYNGFSAGKFDTKEMISFFSAATGAGPVAAVTFLSVFLVDKNKDGRPDAAEKKAGENHER